MSNKMICPECGKEITGFSMMRGVSEMPVMFCFTTSCSRRGVMVFMDAVKDWRTHEVTAEKYQGRKVVDSSLVLVAVRSVYVQEHPAKILSIQEVCSRTGLNGDQIRYYARTGVIKPRRRGNRGKWQFYQKDVNVLNSMINVKRVMPAELGG